MRKICSVFSSSFWFSSYCRPRDTGLYYLQSRYYDPAIGRFINADSYASTGQGFLSCNMFAYCANDPINLLDSDATKAVRCHDCGGGVFGYTDTGTGGAGKQSNPTNPQSNTTGHHYESGQEAKTPAKFFKALASGFCYSIEGRLGLGLGLQGSGSILGFGCDLGAHYDPLEVTFENGQFHINIIQFLLLFFAIDFLVCSIYAVGYSRGLGYEHLPVSVVCADLSLNLMTGIFTLLFSKTISKNGEHNNVKKITGIVGGFLTIGTIISLVLVSLFYE